MTHVRVLPKDENNVAVQTARGFVTSDASGTPKLSPYAFTTTEATVVFPTNAVEMVIVNTDQDLRVSEIATGTATQYFTIPAGTGEVIQMGEGGLVYIKGASATATVQFYFRVL